MKKYEFGDMHPIKLTLGFIIRATETPRIPVWFASGAVDTALAQPSGAGDGASVHCPQTAAYVGNVSVRRSASSAVNVSVESLRGSM